MILKRNQQISKKEFFLYSVIDRVSHEYRSILEELKELKRTKPLKIIKILKISEIPGETKFLIQLKNNRSVISLSAAEIMGSYNLTDFNEFNANMVRYAASGSLIEFLNLSNKNLVYKLEAKFFDRNQKKHFFTIVDKEDKHFVCTGEEILRNRKILHQMSLADVYDIAYTLGAESIIKEQLEILKINSSSA